MLIFRKTLLNKSTNHKHLEYYKQIHSKVQLVLCLKHIIWPDLSRRETPWVIYIYIYIYEYIHIYMYIWFQEIEHDVGTKTIYCNIV